MLSSYFVESRVNRSVSYNFHLFNKLYGVNEKFRSEWDGCQKISANLPHFIQIKGMFNNLTSEVKEHIDEKKIGVYKLSHKIDHENIPTSSSLKYLIDPQNCKPLI